MNHQIVIYQRPAEGDRFLATYTVTGYRHRIDAIGGYDTASCRIATPQAAGLPFLERYTGCRVAVYADNPAVPCWEGFINRITTADYTTSLDEMANRVKVQYTVPSTPTTNQANTAGDDTDSQALYGIKEDTLELGMMYGSSDDRANDLRDAALAARAWPQKSVTQGEPGLVNLELLGFYHTLEWETYVSTATTTTTYSPWLTGVLLPALANGATFFDNTITSEIDTNSGARRYNEHGNRSVWEIISKMAEAGDGSIPWVIGITPTRVTDNARHMYYRAMNTSIEYTCLLSDGRRPRNKFGRVVNPWEVRPDRGIRIMDAMLAWTGNGDNPTETYIKTVEYDAETGAARWESIDSVEAEAAFQLTKVNRATSKRFGAAARVNSV